MNAVVYEKSKRSCVYMKKIIASITIIGLLSITSTVCIAANAETFKEYTDVSFQTWGPLPNLFSIVDMSLSGDPPQVQEVGKYLYSIQFLGNETPPPKIHVTNMDITVNYRRDIFLEIVKFGGPGIIFKGMAKWLRLYYWTFILTPDDSSLWYQIECKKHDLEIKGFNGTFVFRKGNPLSPIIYRFELEGHAEALKLIEYA